MKNSGLLFRLSGSNPGNPECAHGNPVPNFLKDVSVIDDKIFGHVLDPKISQLLAYWAPGNIYSERGTLSFFWKAKEELGETEFPLFRVSMSDHSSWDSLFIRIDWNGKGIDAFVTDINLSRLRIHHEFEKIPGKDEWFHVLFAWDENIGVTLYINGFKVGSVEKRALLYAGLDQFGIHSRVISNAQVQSSYNYQRTGNFAEIRIYDHMVNEKEVYALSQNEDVEIAQVLKRDFNNEVIKNEWMLRHGFEYKEKPYLLSQKSYVLKKVEIHNAWDIKRWWWKACDGIRETTWPGVYNRSRLTGRLDYLVLPDWDCYSQSGKKITFCPDENQEFNHIEISGSAQGKFTIKGIGDEIIYESYRESCERSSEHFAEPLRNVELIFVNDEIEEPIGDITLLDIHPGTIERERTIESYYFATEANNDYKTLQTFISGRFTPDERNVFYATKQKSKCNITFTLPIAQFLIKYEAKRDKGLDGVVIKLPSLANSDDIIYYNIQIKDPLWQYRNLVQANVAIKAYSEKELFFDTRDRILPEGGTLYVTISASNMLNCQFVENLEMDLVFKSAAEAKKEHIEDRLCQVKDNFANLVEENPSNEHFNMFNRFKADLEDLLDVDPNNRLAQEYYYDKFKKNPPEFKQSVCPDSVPLWAWRQCEYMSYIKRFIRWWIDKRQIANGEFGGGLSDDGDLTAWWPGPALAGLFPEKIAASLKKEMEAYYDQGMFCNGLIAIQTDQLHTLEDGIQVLGQCLTMFPNDPLYLERAMENYHGLEFVTGITEKGHRHVISGYYSGSRVALEHPWRYSASDSFHVLHPTYMLARYNGNEKAKKLILEMADSMMEHYYDGRLHVLIDTVTETDKVHERTREWPLFIAAYDLTGDKKYLLPIDKSLYRERQDVLPKKKKEAEEFTATKYERLIRDAALREYINTDAQLWIDRCIIDISEIQEDRCGGIGHIRFALYPRNKIRWTFPINKETDVAIMVTHSEKTKLEFSAFNLSDSSITASMGTDGLQDGLWNLVINGKTEQRTFARFALIQEITFNSGENNFSFELKKAKDIKKLPDLAISKGDVVVKDDCVRVMVHNIGICASSLSKIVIEDKAGSVIRWSNIPPIDAPDDNRPRKVEIPLWTRGLDLTDLKIVIDPENKLEEISKFNNTILFKEIL